MYHRPSFSSGLCEYFTDEENILFSKCDVESLVDRIIEVSQRQEEVRRIADNARVVAKINSRQINLKPHQKVFYENGI